LTSAATTVHDKGVDARSLPKRRKTIAWIAAGGVLLFVAVAIVSYRPVLRRLVHDQALARGVELAPAATDAGWGWVQLRDADFSLVGVKGVSGHLQDARIDLSALSPTRIEVHGVSLRVVGSAHDLLFDLGQWSKDHAGGLAVPMAGDSVDIAWAEQQAAQPWLIVRKATLIPGESGAAVRADETLIAGVAAGKIGAVWKSDQITASLGFGREDLASAPVRVDLHAGDPASAHVVLAPIAVEDLSGALGIQIPLRRVSAEGTSDVTFPKQGTQQGIGAAVHLVLKGFVPPHPSELNGIVFGDGTTLDAQLSLSPDRSRVAISEANVTAGAFKLSGSGSIERKAGYALVGMKLHGTLACTSLARSAAVDHLGNVIGGLVGDLAKHAMTGGLTLAVDIEADTRNLGDAKVRQSVGGSCGVRIP
jgi:ADP-dependent NAD(P)H-hydrate dehydratase / NAD(P)H-hydrate epimerase